MYGTGLNYAPSISGLSGTTGSYAASSDTARGHSNAIWKDCPIADLLQSNRFGTYFFDDFVVTGSADASGAAYANSIGQWASFLSQGGTVSDGALEGGVAVLASDGDNEYAKLQSNAGSFRIITTSTLAKNGKLWFECRVARSTVTTDTIEFFVGLMTPALSSGLPVTAVPITATDDTLSTTPSFLGFHSNSNTGTRGGPTEVAVAFNLASGTVNYPTNLTTLMAGTGNTVLAADTFVKLGFLFDPNPISDKLITSTNATARQTAGTYRKPLIKFFVNGVEHPTVLTSDDVVNATAGQAFPTGLMCPVIAVANTAGSSPGSLKVDWIRVAQLANS